MKKRLILVAYELEDGSLRVEYSTRADFRRLIRVLEDIVGDRVVESEKRGIVAKPFVLSGRDG